MNRQPIRVMQLASNPEYAGVERHVASLIHALRETGKVEPSLVVFHGGQLVDEMQNIGVAVDVVPLRWVFDVTAITRLARILKRWKIDCLHSHGYKANVIGAMAARWAGVPKVVRTEHPMEPYQGFDQLKIKSYEALDTWVGNRLTDQIIAVSDDLRRRLALRYPNKSLITIHNGISKLEVRGHAKVQRLRESLGVSVSTPVIGIVGRLVPVKRHVDFLRAATLIVRQRPETRFIVIGDGPLLHPLRQESERLGLNGTIHFLGFRSDACDWIASLDVLVLSSEYEGVPYTALEAMSLGTCIVATEVGGLPEVIEHGVTGLLVKPKDPEALAQACIHLLGDVKLRHRLSLAGQQRCNAYFSDRHMGEAISNIYYESLPRENSP